MAAPVKRPTKPLVFTIPNGEIVFRADSIREVCIARSPYRNRRTRAMQTHYTVTVNDNQIYRGTSKRIATSRYEKAKRYLL